MLTALAVSGYRSLRDLVIPLCSLNLITGTNGSGKSNLYRALRLLADAAQGNIIQSLALEGGLSSTLWAGPEMISKAVKRGEHPLEPTRRKRPVELKLGFASDEYGYLIDIGLPTPLNTTMFGNDPEIKRECVWHGAQLRPSAMLVDRQGPVVKIRRDDGSWDRVAQNLSVWDSVMARVADPRNAPEVLSLRDLVRAWRFYDSFRADADAPARSMQIGTRTPVLSNDGRDLASALQTIRENLDERLLDETVADAFPGSSVWVKRVNGRLAIQMRQHGLLRPLDAAELSDGTLRYLLWTAVLLSPRPPQLMVLNEPETSLHPDLLPALARLIAQAAKRTQVIAVSHAPPLIEGLTANAACQRIHLKKEWGETSVEQRGEEDGVSWRWPGR